MPFTAYILQNAAGECYIGSTSCLDARLRRHNAGGSTATRGRGPFHVVYSQTFPTRAEAMQCERRWKSFHGGEALRRLLAG